MRIESVFYSEYDFFVRLRNEEIKVASLKVEVEPEITLKGQSMINELLSQI